MFDLLMFHTGEKAAIFLLGLIRVSSQDKRRNGANISCVNKQALWWCWSSFKK